MKPSLPISPISASEVAFLQHGSLNADMTTTVDTIYLFTR